MLTPSLLLSQPPVLLHPPAGHHLCESSLFQAAPTQKNQLHTNCSSDATSYSLPVNRRWCVAAAAAAALVLSPSSLLAFASTRPPPTDDETLSNVPQTLSSPEPGDNANDRKPGSVRVQRPKSRQAETCTVKCLNTCVRGGAGSPGEGPLNIRRPLVVFKQGFRTRQYCLAECSDICNLIKDGEDGP